jgi:hypothetical protein
MRRGVVVGAGSGEAIGESSSPGERGSRGDDGVPGAGPRPRSEVEE